MNNVLYNGRHSMATEEIKTMTNSFPISKYSSATGWIFIKQFNGTYIDALFEAQRLQSEDDAFAYRIWDER